MIINNRYKTQKGLARFHVVRPLPAAEETDRDYPFVLTTGRLLAQYQSGTQTRRVASLMEAAPEPFLEIHPQMARTSGVAEGEMVRLLTRRGEALFRVRFDIGMRMDTLFVPFHWGGEACANLLTNPVLDPISKIPEFKVCAARIEKIAAPS
jgi:assimilatory nitrate reductase catalytic subunit